jgi:hypothetical protein
MLLLLEAPALHALRVWLPLWLTAGLLSGALFEGKFAKTNGGFLSSVVFC